MARWVWKEYTKRWTNEEFSQIQAERGRRGGLAKGKANTEKRAQAQLLAAKGCSQRIIAGEIGVSQKTISNWLSK